MEKSRCKAEILVNMKNHDMEAVSETYDFQKSALMCHLSLIPQFRLTKPLIVKRARFAGVESETRGQVESKNQGTMKTGNV